MKKITTILLVFISAIAYGQQMNFPDIRIGSSVTGKIAFKARFLHAPYIQDGLSTDSVLTIAGGVIKKVPRSQFSGGGGGAVNSVYGRTGDVVAVSTDYSAFYPLLTSTYNNPVWINTLAYSKITGVPAFLTTETDPVWSGVASTYRTKTQNDALYEPIFSKNTAFNKNFGTASGTVAEGNDSRINNGQTAFGWGNHASAGYQTLANLSTSTSLGTSNILYPSQNAVKVYADTKQTQLNGLGFVKANGTSITYDNTSYYPASNPNGYLSSIPNLQQVTTAGNIITRATSGTTGTPIVEDILRYGVDASSVSKIRGVNTLSSNFGTGLSFQTNNPASANTNVESMRVMYGRTTFGSMRPLYIDNDVSVPSQINGIYYDTDNSGYSFGIGKVVSGTKTNQITLTDANVVQITGSATITGYLGVNGDIASGGNVTGNNLGSGTYNPTVSNLSNISSSTPYQGLYSRVGNIVTLSGTVRIATPTTGALSFQINLPIASAFTSVKDASGTASGNSVSFGTVQANTSNGNVLISGSSNIGGVTQHDIFFTFQYIIK